MKKGIFGFMAILAVFAMTMTMACSSGGGGSPPPPAPPGPPPGPPVGDVWTVTFVTNGGTDVEPLDVEDGGLIDADYAVTEKEDFIFDAWYTSNEDGKADDDVIAANKWDFAVDTVNEDMDLYARWLEDPNKTYWTVTLDPKGGEIESDEFRIADTRGIHSSESLIPRKDFLEFAGWYSDSSLSTLWIFIGDDGENFTPVTGDVTLYAKWNATVTFNTNGGTAIPAVKVNVTDDANGNVIPSGSWPGTITRPNAVFDAWYSDEGLEEKITSWDDFKVKINTSVYAGWKVTITFEVDHTDYNYTGAVPADVDIPADKAIGDNLPGELVGDGENWRFDAWYNGTTKVTSASTFAANTTLTGKFKADERLKITFSYVGTDVAKPDVVIRLEEGQSFQDAGKEIPSATGTKDGSVFGYWIKQGDTQKVRITSESSFSANTTIVPLWWAKEVTASDAMEKVWLGNTQFAIYEFDISTKDYADITHISADFMASEATIGNKTLRPLRPMGPYFYNDTPIEGPEGWKYYGDFVPDANGAYATKFNGDGAKGYFDFNKFHPFLLNNVGPNWSQIAGYDSANGTQAAAGTWFNVKVATSGYGWNNGTNSPTRVKGFITADAAGDPGDNTADPPVPPRPAHSILSEGTDFTKVYFGFGLASADNPHNANNGHDATEDDHGITTLVKNVKIHFSDGSSVAGTIPELPARSQKIESGHGVITDGTGTTKQVFAAYIYNVQYNWRGEPTATVVPPKDPLFVPPEVVEPATEIKVIDEPEDINLDVSGTGVTVDSAELTVTVDISTRGQFGGFFIELPSDWNAYEKIDIHYTARKLGAAGDPAKVTIKQGKASYSADYAPGTQYAQYKDIDTDAGEHTFALLTRGFNSVSAMAEPGISFQINVNADSDVPQKWEFTIVKIVLTPTGM